MDLNNKTFLPALTGFRYVAAASVLIGHGAAIMPDDLIAHSIQQITSVGMTLFFVLSGFVLWITYAKSLMSGITLPKLKSFAVARFARLYPLYIFVLIGALSKNHFNTTLPAALYFTTMTQAWFPVVIHGSPLFSAISGAQHTWSISAEIFFYLFFPVFVIWIAANQSRSAVILKFFINLAFAYAIYHLFFKYGPIWMNWAAPKLQAEAMPWLTYYGPYYHLPQFIAGCIAGHAYLITQNSHPSDKEQKWAGSMLPFLLFGCLIMPACLELSFHLHQYYWHLNLITYLAEVTIIPLLIFHVARYSSIIKTVLTRPALIWGGEWSYSIYLLHPFLLHYFEADSTYMMGYGEYGLRLCAMLIGITLISSLTYFLIEKPGRTFIRKIFDTPSLTPLARPVAVE